MSGVDAVQIRPMLVYIGDNTKQVQQISVISDTDGSLAGKYFLMHEPGGAGHAFWLDDGVVADPTIAGTWTLHPVAYVQDDSASVIAGKISTVIAALTTKFNSAVSGAVITVSNVVAGYSQPARDALAPASQTGFGFVVKTLGFVETYAGNIDGDIELSGLKTSAYEIKTHAGGSTVQGEIVTGYDKPALKMTFMDSDIETIKRALILGGGHVMTPEGAGAAITGWGQTAIGSQLPRVRVRLHPVSKDKNDHSADWYIWQASFNPDSFVFSGEKPTVIPQTIAIYPDESKPKLVQFFAVGDASALIA